MKKRRTGCQKHKNADISRELRRSASEGTRWYVQEEIPGAPALGSKTHVQALPALLH